MRNSDWMRPAVALAVMICALPSVAEAARSRMAVDTSIEIERSALKEAASEATSPWVYLGPQRANVSRLAFSPQDPSRVLAVLDERDGVALASPLFESHDLGASWQREEQFLGLLYDLVTDSSSRELAVGTLGLLARSADATAFERIDPPEGLPPFRPDRIAVGAGSDAPVWMAGGGVILGEHRLLRLDHSLQLWTDVLPELPQRTLPAELAVSELPGQVALAVVDPATGASRVYVTRDDGENWTMSTPPGSTVNLTSLRWVGDQLFLGGFSGDNWRAALWVSDDGGDSWALRLLGEPDQPGGMDTAVDPTQPGRVWAGTGEGVYRSDDGGLTWQAPAAGGPTGILRLEYQPESGQLWAGLREDGVWASADGGDTWLARNHRLGSQPVVALDSNPQQPGELAVAVRSTVAPTGQVTVSDNGGLDWTQNVAPAGEDVGTVRYAPSGTLYATLTGFQEYTLLRRDADSDWVDVGLDLPDNFFVDPGLVNVGESEDTLLQSMYVYDFDTLEWMGEVWRSGDAGASWNKVYTYEWPTMDITAIERTETFTGVRLFLLERPSFVGDDTNRLWASDDDGLTWFQSTTPFGTDLAGAVCTGDGGQVVLYGVQAGTPLSSLHRSLNGGDSWILLAGGFSAPALPVSSITSLHCPFDGRKVFLGNALGELWMSTDGGGSFGAQPLATDAVWGRTRIESIALTDTGLYVTTGNGVWVNPEVAAQQPAPHGLLVESTNARMRHRTTLQWTGGEPQVDVLRNGLVVDTVANNGTWTTLLLGPDPGDEWQVCNAGTTDCSGSAGGR